MSDPNDPNPPPLTHVAADGRVRMVDVGDKPPTQRRAVAEGRVRISPALAQAIQANTLQKGNLLETARLAGIQAAKRTDELIPLAHPLELNFVDVAARLEGHSVYLRAEVRVLGPTGVEMEALTAVSVAALTVIDMGKALDRGMVIESIRLLEKSGGRSGDYQAGAMVQPAATSPTTLSPPMRAAVLTVSDRCSQGLTVDTSGPALARLLKEQLAAEVMTTACTADQRDAIASQLRAWSALEPPPDVILTTGGTGLASRDVTPEATLEVLERRHDGLMELIRARTAEKTPRAYLSRGVAGTLGRSLILNLPGSERGAVECLQAVAELLPHAVATLRDVALHADPRSGGTKP